MTRRIIFLDFDGVITTPRSRWMVDTDLLQRLNRIVIEADADIVISSSWRIRFDKGILKEILGSVAGPRVIGITNDKGMRGEAIDDWLNDDKTWSHFVVLDDEAFDMDKVKDNLIKTTMEIGLTDEDVERAIKMLTP